MDLDARQQRLFQCERRATRRRADHAVALALGTMCGCLCIAAFALAGLCLLLELHPWWAKGCGIVALLTLLTMTGLAVWDMGREVQYQRWVHRQG